MDCKASLLFQLDTTTQALEAQVKETNREKQNNAKLFIELQKADKTILKMQEALEK